MAQLQRRWRSWLTALAAALATATTVTAAPMAHAANPVICGQKQTVAVSGGAYIVQNNEWNDSIQQCVEAWDGGFGVTTGWHDVATNGAPAAYPSIYAGCHYTVCSTGNGLPLQVSAFGNPQSHVNFYTASGQWDSAYDIWFNTASSTAGQNDGAELMIWADHSGAPSPFGSKQATVSIEGAAWDVWIGRMPGSVSWNVVSYVRQQPSHDITVNIKDFTNDMQSRNQLQSWWWMTSVQFGFEPWQGGPGLGVNSFSFTANASGGGGGGQELVGQGSGRCLDINGFGTADGTPVQLWDCYRTTNQLWNATGGQLVNPSSGKCLDVSGAGTADGTAVQLWSCNGTGAQQWRMNANGTVTNPNSGKCLDAAGQGTADGTHIQIWDCYGGGGTQSNQVWSLQ